MFGVSSLQQHSIVPEPCAQEAHSPTHTHMRTQTHTCTTDTNVTTSMPLPTMWSVLFCSVLFSFFKDGDHPSHCLCNPPVGYSLQGESTGDNAQPSLSDPR